MNNQKRYTLHFLYYGWEDVIHSNELNELTNKAKELIILNSGKPFIITNQKDEIVREYTPRIFNFIKPKYSDNFKVYRESMKEIDLELEEEE